MPPCTILVYAYRKPGMSATAFREHWEGRHMPLVQQLTGPLFPKKHTRHYILREQDQPKVLVGTPEDFAYDGFAEMEFEDQNGFRAFFAKMQDPEVKKQVEADEELFLDRTKLRAALIGEITQS